MTSAPSADASPAEGRLLGVDLGSKRVGLALTDPRRMICSPHGTIPMTTEPALVRELLRLCRAHAVSLVVIGLPLSADGTEGPGCARARRVARAMESAGVSSRLQDERWTSREAEDILREAGRTRRTSREKVDAIAASLILSEYLRDSSRS